MGLFDKIFEKKECGVCGGEIGMLGNRKLEDANLCKSCASKLSPLFSDRRRSTLAEIKEQLAYREDNKERVAQFNPTRTIGSSRKIIFDEDAGCFIVTSSSKWRDDNPDVIDFTQVTGCDNEIQENRVEQKYTNNEGEEVSYQPPRYNTYYNFTTTIHINSPYFSEIKIKLNTFDIEREGSAEFNDMKRQAEEIKELLSKVRDETRERVAQSNAPKQAVVCPHCGATTFADASGRCEYCGAPVNE